MHKEKVWNKILSELSLEIDQNNLTKFRSLLTLGDVNQEKLIIRASNRFVYDWVRKNYHSQIENAAGAALGNNVKLLLEIDRSPEKIDNAAPLSSDSIASSFPVKSPDSSSRLPLPKHPMLVPEMTFENFIVGPSNQFAHAACKAFSEKNARNYNPMFIYGGVGLGKTHLLNAVGNRMHDINPSLKIISIQAESFIRDMIEAIRKEKMEEFRSKYRNQCDVLLMDDVYILAGKERTQEEFFYTFNELIKNGKKIIFTSDKMPREMTTLEERLKSRFESGMMVDIQPPEFETRLAIMKYFAEVERMILPDDVAFFMADKIRSNIRKLKGCMIRLAALSSLSGTPITLDLANDIMMAIIEDEDSKLTSELIMKIVADYFKIKVSDLKSPKRNRKYTVPRQIAMYLCRQLCDMSFPEIGQAFGGRDHSTVIHSCKKIGVEKNTDRELERHIDCLKKQLKINHS